MTKEVCQFLNSILASVQGDASQASPPSGVAAQTAKATSTVRYPEGPPKTPNAQSSATKRKADAQPIGAPPIKASRSAILSTSTGIKNDPISISVPPNAASESKPSPMSPGTQLGLSKDISLPTASASRPPPKKGSYKEIMARAQAAKEAQADFGKIKHKKVSTLSKRERAAYEAALAATSKGKGTDNKLAGMGKKLDRSRAGDVPTQHVKEKKKGAELSYQGTARVNGASSIAKAQKPAPMPSHKQTKRSSKLVEPDEDEGDVIYHKQYKYAGSSEEEEEEDDDGSDDDGSEEMGGGGFAELEEEEQRSLRLAQREDAEALREENELKRAKLERKKKLEQLAAKAPKPGV